MAGEIFLPGQAHQQARQRDGQEAEIIQGAKAFQR